MVRGRRGAAPVDTRSEGAQVPPVHPGLGGTGREPRANDESVNKFVVRWRKN